MHRMTWLAPRWVSVTVAAPRRLRSASDAKRRRAATLHACRSVRDPLCPILWPPWSTRTTVSHDDHLHLSTKNIFTEGLRQRTPSPNPAFVSALRAGLATRRAQHPLPEHVPMSRPRLPSGLFLRNHTFLHSSCGAPACGAPSSAHLWLLLRLLGLSPPLFPRPPRPSLAPLFFLVPLPTG